MHARGFTWILVFVLSLASSPAGAQSGQSAEEARRKMVEEAVVGAGVEDERVIEAMRKTPRHQFVARHLWPQAYLDMALPIGQSQTISSPFIVAYMTESLDPQPTDKVLEIGTGSGYQAAVLSPLVKEVYSIEIVEALGNHARRTLDRLGYDNVHVKVGDGFQGWPEHAPFDKIIVTCSPEKVPQPLVDQLAEGGLMVIPVGERYKQTLYLFRKKNGKLEAESLRPTLFVPMTGAAEKNRRVQPDPANPQVENGDFEQPLDDDGFVPGWYYQRQLTWKTDSGAPQGEHYVAFENEEAGRAAHLMQGLAVDGRRVRQLTLSAWVQTLDVQPGRTRDEAAAVVITFYDEDRRELGSHWLGPFHGDTQWHRAQRAARVPPKAREAIVRIGLFGATGEASFDAVRLKSGS